MDDLLEFSGRIEMLRVKGTALGASLLYFELRNASGGGAFVLDPSANAQRFHLQSNALLAAATHDLTVHVLAKRADPAPIAIDVGISPVRIKEAATPAANASPRKSRPASKTKKKTAPKRRR